MGNLILVRHGESEHNAQRIICGDAESPLTEKGRAEVAEAAQHLPEHIDHVFVSPLERAQETWKILARTKGLPHQPTIVPELRERNLGNVVGQPEDTYKAQWEHDWVTWNGRPPEGESYAEVAKRVLPWLHQVALPLASKETVLIVGHNGVFKIIRTFLEEIPQNETSQEGVPNGGRVWYEVKSPQEIVLKSVSQLTAGQEI